MYYLDSIMDIRELRSLRTLDEFNCATEFIITCKRSCITDKWSRKLAIYNSNTNAVQYTGEKDNLLILRVQAIQKKGTVISIQCLLKQNIYTVCTWRLRWNLLFVTLGFVFIQQIEISQFLPNCLLIWIIIKDSVNNLTLIYIKYQYQKCHQYFTNN